MDYQELTVFQASKVLPEPQAQMEPTELTDYPVLTVCQAQMDYQVSKDLQEPQAQMELTEPTEFPVLMVPQVQWDQRVHQVWSDQPDLREPMELTAQMELMDYQVLMELLDRRVLRDLVWLLITAAFTMRHSKL